MQVGSRYVAAAVNRAAPRSQTKMMRLMTPKMWITVTTIATDQSVIRMMASTYTFLARRSYCSTTRALSKTLCPGPGSPRAMEVIASTRTTWVSSFVSAVSGPGSMLLPPQSASGLR